MNSDNEFYGAVTRALERTASMDNKGAKLMAKSATSKVKPTVYPTSRNDASARRNLRFQPEPDTIAQVDLVNTGAEKKFKPTVAALVMEESYRGCGLVMVTDHDMQVGRKLRIQVGLGPSLLGEVRWRTELDSQVVRVGIMYLE